VVRLGAVKRQRSLACPSRREINLATGELTTHRYTSQTIEDQDQPADYRLKHVFNEDRNVGWLESWSL